MRKPISSPLRASVAILLHVLFPGLSFANELTGTLAVEIREQQAPGVPILMNVTIRNTGHQTFYYWCGGPASYPIAKGTKAIVTDEKGVARELSLSNGQATHGSGSLRAIEPGATAKFPAVMEPLLPGAYSITLGSGVGGWVNNDKFIADWPAMATTMPVAVTVLDDPPAASAFEQDMLKRVRTAEPFAQHVVVTYPRDAITSALIADLHGDDVAIAGHAVDTLRAMPEVPRDLPKALARMMMHHLESERYPADLMHRAALLAGKIGSDEVLDPVLRLFERAQGGYARRASLQHLRLFKQAKANTVLRNALRDREPEVRAVAGIELARRGDAGAIDALTDPEVLTLETWTRQVYDSLARFPDDPRALSAIQAGVKLPDARTRQSAERALRTVEYWKAQREKAATQDSSR